MFIELTGIDGEKLLVNLRHLDYIGSGKTVLIHFSDHSIPVKESYSHIRTLINSALEFYFSDKEVD